jgi:hypothetical protein
MILSGHFKAKNAPKSHESHKYAKPPLSRGAGGISPQRGQKALNARKDTREKNHDFKMAFQG